MTECDRCLDWQKMGLSNTCPACDLYEEEGEMRKFLMCGNPVEIHEWTTGELSPDSPEWWQIDAIKDGAEIYLVDQDSFNALEEENSLLRKALAGRSTIEANFRDVQADRAQLMDLLRESAKAFKDIQDSRGSEIAHAMLKKIEKAGISK